MTSTSTRDDLAWLVADVDDEIPASQALVHLEPTTVVKLPAPSIALDTVDEAADAVDHLLTLEQRIERLDNAQAAAVKRYKARRAYYESQLEESERDLVPALDRFYDAHPPSKGKTLHLPTGDLQRRKQPKAGELSIKDRDLCVAWAEEHLPAAIVTETIKNLDAQRVRMHFADTGEIPPGAEVIPDVEKLHIKAPKPKKEA